MLTDLSMAGALVMLAAVVVAKIVTMEMLAGHHRRYAHQLERLEVARAQLRAAVHRHAAVEREWRSAENKRHRLNLRRASADEQISLFERDRVCREAHFGLLTSHLVDR